MIAAGMEYVQKGDGAPVICLHGIGGGVESFRSQLNGLSGYRVIALNLPGYGASVPCPAPTRFASLSLALAGFIEELQIGRVHLLGHSIGGMLALEHAIRRRDQVATLTLIATTPSFGGRDDRFRSEFLRARLAPLEAGQSMAEMAACAARRLVGPGADDQTIAAVAAPMAAVPEATWRDILDCLITFDRRNDLKHVDRPVCLIAGSADNNVPARAMARMAEKLPCAEYHQITGAGHMIQQEAPEQTNAIITAFFGKYAA